MRKSSTTSSGNCWSRNKSAAARLQTPANPKTAGSLRGGRFQPFSSEEITSQQKSLLDRVVSGKMEGGANGPLNVLLRSPDYGEAIQRYGAYDRFHTP